MPIASIPPMTIEQLEKSDDGTVRGMDPSYLLSAGRDEAWVAAFESRVMKMKDVASLSAALEDRSFVNDDAKRSAAGAAYDRLRSDVERFGFFTKYSDVLKDDSNAVRAFFSFLGPKFLDVKKRIESGVPRVDRDSGSSSVIVTERMRF